MRLVELILVLIVEGRQALPQGHLSVFRRMESISSGLCHRQVIELIRNGNVEEFIEIMEAGTYVDPLTLTCT